MPFRTATSPEVAWLAGIIEGEGYLSAKRGHGLVRVVMTDADVVARLYAVSAVGKLNDLPLRAAHHKPVYSWTILREESVLTLLTSVAPLLGTRRRTRAEEVLALHGRELPAAYQMAPGSPEAWGWVAGMIEGEGYVVPGPDSKDQRPRIGLQMVDFDVIDRLAAITRVGTICNITPRRQTEQPLRRWTVDRREHIRLVLQNILPYLGERRANRARYVLDLMSTRQRRVQDSNLRGG